MAERPGVVIRTAAEKDLPAMEWEGAYRRFRNMYRRAFTESLLGHRLLLVAEEDQEIIGQVFVQLRSDPRLPANDPKLGYLYALRVRPQHRGHGVGTQLIEEAERQLVRRGFRRVLIAVSMENDKARRLYQRLGYRVVGEDPGEWTYVDDEGNLREVHEPAFLMEKHLPPPAPRRRGFLPS